MDCISMEIDTVTYLGNLYAEVKRQSHELSDLDKAKISLVFSGISIGILKVIPHNLHVTGKPLLCSNAPLHSARLAEIWVSRRVQGGCAAQAGSSPGSRPEIRDVRPTRPTALVTTRCVSEAETKACGAR